MTRRVRRNIDVEDYDVGGVELELDALDFDVRIGDERSVNRGERNGVVDEESHSTPSPPLSVFIDEVVAGDGRKARRVVEVCLLDGGDADLLVVDEVAKFGRLVVDAVAVPLKQ